jgi:hypothetical protein
MEMIKGGAGIASVLGHESRQSIRPPSSRRSDSGSPAMPLDAVDHGRAGNLEPAVPFAKVAFIFSGVGEARPDEVTGAASDQQPSYRLGLWMYRSQRLLLAETPEIGDGFVRQHGADFAEGERAGDVQEVAH